MRNSLFVVWRHSTWKKLALENEISICYKSEGVEGAGQGINDGLCRLGPTFSKTGTKVSLVYSYSDTNI